MMFMMVGPAMPGKAFLTSSSEAFGTSAMRYFLFSASVTLSMALMISCTCCSHPSYAFRLATTTACDSAMTASSRRWFILSVEPLDTRSTMISATPSMGAISAAPAMEVISTFLPSFSKYCLVRLGNEVATTRSSGRSSGLFTFMESGTATDRRQRPKFRRYGTTTSSPDSRTRS
ncbi:hypothetical protein DSECCO2_299030 [anaerobic digester metagenome]